MTPSQISLHVYADFDSTVVLQDTGNTLLAHQIGQQELERLDHLPEKEPGQVSLRKAEDMKWERVRLSVQEAADILVDPSSDQRDDGSKGSYSTTTTTTTTTTTSCNGAGRMQSFEEQNSGATETSFYVQLDPGFRQFHRYCQEHKIPITIISIGIQPLIEEMLDRYLGFGHGIRVRANGLTTHNDGSWKVIWRDSSPFGVEKGRALRDARADDLKNPNSDHILWCGDGSSDFAAALRADIVLARQHTSLEKLCRANHITHSVFTTFDTVLDAVKEWIREHPKSIVDGDVNASEP